ncbi:uncharacterized protein LOC121863463 [Homarus americanus]|uniref:uncharacterized protein LOC121863463 n=1 Tax=Homarus americanus TaxID=6706 RepID=UPI001C493168|nr:uncharacterized protein LOC121863463 [Homarus americanus]
MESQEEQNDQRKRVREEGVVDRQTVVKDLENTISNLFTYLTSNSPTNPDLSSLRDIRLTPDDEAQRSRELTPAESVNSIAREVISPLAFRPVSEADSTSRSHLITPPGAFHAISEEGIPPPLPGRRPPVVSPSNSDLFSSSVDKRYSPATRSSVISKTSPSPSRWITESPFGLRDRKSLMSSVNSKTSSDIELVYLLRGDGVNDGLNQSFSSVSERVRPLYEGARLPQHPDSDYRVSAFTTPPSVSSASRLMGHMASEPTIFYPTKLPSVGNISLDTPPHESRRTPVQYQTNRESQVDVSGQSPHSTSRSSPAPHPSSSSLQSLPQRSKQKIRPPDHHYSEIDLYDPAQDNDSTTRTASPNTLSSMTISTPPPVPQHCEDRGKMNGRIFVNPVGASPQWTADVLAEGDLWSAVASGFIHHCEQSETPHPMVHY